MKKNKLTLAAIIISASLPLISLAATANLYNGGLGQSAGNTSQFGLAICNGGTSAINESVPVSISTNGQTTSISSNAPIAAKACAYSYVPYSTLGMSAGKTYSVVATIDPTHSVISNSNNQATYSVMVPSATVASANPSMGAGTADVNAQSGNFFSAIWHWFVGLF